MFKEGILEYCIDEEHACLIQDVMCKFFVTFSKEYVSDSLRDRARAERF